MIRNLIFLLAVSLCATETNAQSQPGNGNQTGNKTTAIASRMIAKNHLHMMGTTGVRDDSINMYYATAYRGYSPALHFPELQSDEVHWLYDSAAAHVPNSILVKYNNTYDANARLTLATEYYLTGTLPSGIYVKNQEYTFTYNTAGKMLSRLKAYYSNFTTWDTSLITVTYNTAGFMDTLKVQKRNVALQTWEMQTRTTFTYNTSNKLTSKNVVSYLGGNPSWRDYTYDVSGNITKEELFVQSGANPPYVAQRKTHTYTGADITATVTESHNGTSLVNDKRNAYTYNSYHQVLNDTMFFWNTGNSTYELNGANVFNYYYENYTDTTVSVNNIQANTVSFNVFPVPAGNTLYVTTSFAIAENTVLAIYDMAGRMAMQKTLPSSDKLKMELDISTLPAGNYTVQLNTPTISWVQKLTVVK
jgi:hypothetical protein